MTKADIYMVKEIEDICVMDILMKTHDQNMQMELQHIQSLYCIK